MHFLHYALAVAISLVVGGVLGYAFRGKERAALAAADSKAQSVVSAVSKKLQ